MPFQLKTSSLLVAAVLLMGMVAPFAWANKAFTPSPKPDQPDKQGNTHPIILRPLDGQQGPSQIVIPKAMVKQLENKAVEKRKADAATGTSRTVVAGLALSMALCFGGFWLLRRPDDSGHVKQALVLAACLLPAGLWVAKEAVGNVAPIPPQPPNPPKPLPAAEQPSVQAVVGNGKVIELRLSEADFKRLLVGYMNATKKDVDKNKVRR